MRTPVLFVLLTSLLFLAGCKEPPPWAKEEGPLFSGPQTPPAGKALVYLYWPSEGGGDAKRVWAMAGQEFFEEIRRGGYTQVAVPPKGTSFSASVLWNLTLGVGGSANQEYGGVTLDAEADRVCYLRIEQGTRFGFTWFDFREVDPAVAGPEIGKCRRMVPVTRFSLRARNAATRADGEGKAKR